MYRNCKNITTLDLSNWDTTSVTSNSNMQQIFYGCGNLETIYVSDKFVITPYYYEVFNGCEKLVGGSGTKYIDIKNARGEGEAKKSTYARVDGGESTPGYFTLKQN